MGAGWGDGSRRQREINFKLEITKRELHLKRQCDRQVLVEVRGLRRRLEGMLHGEHNKGCDWWEQGPSALTLAAAIS